MQYFAGVKGRDEVLANMQAESGTITDLKLTAIGCLPFLKLVDEYRSKIKGELKSLMVPRLLDHSSLIIRELMLKLKGEWDFPYKEVMLCHCRAISCARVDAAVIFGSRSAEEVAKSTSAGTGCGTCRKDTENIIRYRLG
ncbi:MAG: (2Fe-2S)-binding protein [Pseudomonadota bacterium]|nr:(2Fe-2S)-binding protein [Pseudomonadota bacterium]